MPALQSRVFERAWHHAHLFDGEATRLVSLLGQLRHRRKWLLSVLFQEKNRMTAVGILIGLIAGTLLVAFFDLWLEFCLWERRKKRRSQKEEKPNDDRSDS